MAGKESSNVKRLQSQEDSIIDGGGKKGISGDERSPYALGTRGTVYRYLCPKTKVRRIIGRDGEIVGQLMDSTGAKIIIGGSAPGCERLVTICSSNDESNATEDADRSAYVSPAQDALIGVYERVIGSEPLGSENFDVYSHDSIRDSVRLLVPSDQIELVTGEDGQTIRNIQNDTGAQIHILKTEHLPLFANRDDEVIKITGPAPIVMMALVQVSSFLRGRSSCSQIICDSGNATGELSSFHPQREVGFSKMFSLRLVCPLLNIAKAIDEGGNIINNIREQSGASIEVDNCVISIFQTEHFGDLDSSTIDAAVGLQSTCSHIVQIGDGSYFAPLYITRLLVPRSQILCLIGKDGCIINRMQEATRANIFTAINKIVMKDASEYELIEISGKFTAARNALIQVSMRLRANIFGQDSALAKNLEDDDSQAKLLSLAEGI